MYLTDLWLFTLALAFVIPCNAASYTYWVDTSCSSRPGWSDWIQETFTMAQRTGDKLKSDSDEDFARVFKRIFSVDKGDSTQYDRTDTYKKVHKMDPDFKEKDAAFNIVNLMMSSMGVEWQLVTSKSDRENSHARIYCDNGAHFSEPSKKEPGQWVDPENKIRSLKKCSGNIIAYTSLSRLRIKETEPQQNKQRSTITICETAFRKINKPNIYARLGDIQPKKDLSKMLDQGVKALKDMISLILLHEFAHFYPYLLDDEPDSLLAYGWDNIVAKSPADSLKNADNIAYLGLWAILANRKPGGKVKSGGYTLASPWLDPDSDGGKEAEKDAKARFLKAYKDITDSVNGARRIIKKFQV